MNTSRYCATAVLMAASSTSVGFADQIAEIGYDDLVARLTEAGLPVPDGGGLNIGQVEAIDGGYAPDPSNFQISQTNLDLQSGATGNSTHATLVGAYFYGRTFSPCPEVDTAFIWEANDFIGSGFLKYGTSSTPASLDASIKAFNHSYIFSFSSTSANLQVLRRADFAANSSKALWTCGVNNGATTTTPVGFAGMYHALAVGLTNGNHSHTDTGVGADGIGRMKPDIVAPATQTSYAAPMVAACGLLLYETREMTPELADDSSSAFSQVIRSALLAGAVRNEDWTNLDASPIERGVTARPFDEIFGAGVVNIDRAHRIYTGLRQDGESSLPAADTLVGPAWDFESMSQGEALWHRFTLTQPADEIAIAASWNRTVPSTFASSAMPNIDLELYRIDGGSATPLRGEGAVAFGGGNVVSESAVDNHELLHVTGLPAGEYAVRALRNDLVSASARMGLAILIPEAGDPPLLGDLDGDGRVNGSDFGTLLAGWGSLDPALDLDGSGSVGGGDVGVMLANWTG